MIRNVQDTIQQNDSMAVTNHSGHKFPPSLMTLSFKNRTWMISNRRFCERVFQSCNVQTHSSRFCSSQGCSDDSTWPLTFAVFLRHFSFEFSLLATPFCNISKKSARVSLGVPNTERQMKERGQSLSAFIFSKCLEPMMKHEARVFDDFPNETIQIYSVSHIWHVPSKMLSHA